MEGVASARIVHERFVCRPQHALVDTAKCTNTTHLFALSLDHVNSTMYSFTCIKLGRIAVASLHEALWKSLRCNNSPGLVRLVMN